MPKTVRNIIDFNEKDLIDGKHRRDAAGVLRIEPLAFMVQLYYFSTSPVQKSVAKDAQKRCDAAVKRIRKLINAEAADLVKDVLALQKNDKDGDDKAAGKATKRIKTAVGKLDDTYPDQLRDELRKAIDRMVSEEKSNPVFKGVKSKSETAGRHGFRSARRAILLENGAFQYDAGVDASIEKAGASVFTEGKKIQEDAGKEVDLRKKLTALTTRYEASVERCLKNEPGYPFRGQMPKDRLESIVSRVSAAARSDQAAAQKAQQAHAAFLGKFAKEMQGRDKQLAKMVKIINDKKKSFPDKLRAEARRDLLKMQKNLGSLQHTLKDMVARSEEMSDLMTNAGIGGAVQGAAPWSKTMNLMDKAAYSAADVKAMVVLGKKVQKVVESAGS